MVIKFINCNPADNKASIIEIFSCLHQLISQYLRKINNCSNRSNWRHQRLIEAFCFFISLFSIRCTRLSLNIVFDYIFLKSFISKFSPKISLKILKLFSGLAFCLTNKLLKYIKSLIFGFSVIFPNDTISKTKKKMIALSSDKIRAVRITMYIVKVFGRMWNRFTGWFLLFPLFHVII